MRIFSLPYDEMNDAIERLKCLVVDIGPSRKDMMFTYFCSLITAQLVDIVREDIEPALGSIKEWMCWWYDPLDCQLTWIIMLGLFDAIRRRLKYSWNTRPFTCRKIAIKVTNTVNKFCDEVLEPYVEKGEIVRMEE